MGCKNHPENEATLYCTKYNRYVCMECASCQDDSIYCKYRSSCMIWEIVRHGTPDEQSAVAAELENAGKM